MVVKAAAVALPVIVGAEAVVTVPLSIIALAPPSIYQFPVVPFGLIRTVTFWPAAMFWRAGMDERVKVAKEPVPLDEEVVMLPALVNAPPPTAMSMIAPVGPVPDLRVCNARLDSET